jgi:murein DD-endopeptidase MepM/ murein hydrolase activator NlpD
MMGLAFVATVAAAQTYRFPMDLPDSGQLPYVTAYRDLDDGDAVQDWNCGGNAYDGHRGTDFGIGGFAVMDAGSRWIVAAASGRVTFVVDGCFDRCTGGDCGCGGGFGNYVKVTHADGKSTYYGHMMNGSVAVALEDEVTCGQRLGKVGSSGNSTGPHLHFEPRYASNTSDDPFAGPCGGPESFWVDQGAYDDLPSTMCEDDPPAMDEPMDEPMPLPPKETPPIAVSEEDLDAPVVVVEAHVRTREPEAPPRVGTSKTRITGGACRCVSANGVFDLTALVAAASIYVRRSRRRIARATIER